MKTAIFTFIFAGLTANATAPYTPEMAIEQAQALKNPSVENFLTTIPASLLKEHIPAYASRSNQHADSLNPRIFLFNENMVMTYNGHGFGSNEVEIMHFNPNTQTLEFYDLNFADGQFKFEKNPERCTACHSDTLKIIWPSVSISPFWPGIYGSGSAAATSEDELATLREFVKAQIRSPRYGILPNLEKTFPYISRDEDSVSLFERTSRLELKLAEWSALSNFQKWKNLPQFKQMRPALLLAMACITDSIKKWNCQLDPFLELLGQLTNQKDAQWIFQFKNDEKRIQENTNKESERKWQMISKGLNIPMDTINQRNERFKHYPNIADQHARVAASLLHIERTFNLPGLTESLSSNLAPDRFEYLGSMYNPQGLFGALEKLIFESVMADAPELELKPIHRLYNQWNSGESMITALTKLHKLDSGCEPLLKGNTNDKSH